MFHLNTFNPFQCPEFSTSLVNIFNLRKAPQAQTVIKVSFSFWPIMPSSRPLRPALSCSVLWYLTSPRIRCISSDQLNHGLHNLRASRPPGPSLARLCAGGATLSSPAQLSVPDPGRSLTPAPSDPGSDRWQRARAGREVVEETELGGMEMHSDSVTGFRVQRC